MTTLISLESLGGIADWIDQTVTTMLTDAITPMVASITDSILPVVAVGLSISLLWYAWLIMTGAIQTPVMEATAKLFRTTIIVTVAGTGGLYQQQIAETMLELPTAVVKAFTGQDKTPAQFMDDTANTGSEIGTKLQDRAPRGISNIAKSFVFVLISLIITVLSALLSALGMLVLISVKIGMGLVVVLGPFCILALLFEPTKVFFRNWIHQGLYYAVYAGLFTVVFTFIISMFKKLQEGLLGLTEANELNIFSMLTAIVFFVVCSKFILEQVSAVAAAITGGNGGGLSVPILGRIG